MNQQRTKLTIIIITILIVIGAAAFYILNYTGFRVTDRDPAGNIPLSISKITFTMSDPIVNEKPNITINPAAEGSFTVDDNKVTFTPTSAFKENTKYTVSFTDIEIDVIGKPHSTKSSFKAVYVPYNKLSAEEQAYQQAQTDPIYNRYPITKELLPHVTTQYKIEYNVPYGEEEKLIINITPLIGQGSRESTADYQARLIVLKDAALKYITDGGFKLDDYTIFFTDQFLSQFNHEHHHEEEVFAAPPDTSVN